MIKVFVEGREIRRCGWCGCWYEGLSCSCLFERQSKEVEKLLNTFRKGNEKDIKCCQ